jgi:integrase
MHDTDRFHNIPRPSLQYLNTRQAIDYREERAELNEWLKTVGKNPDKYEGYSDGAAKNYASRIDQFLRWVWEKSGYTTHPTHEQADEYIDLLAQDLITTQRGDSYSESSKRKMSNALERYFEWLAATRDGEEWDPQIQFTDSDYTPPDAFTRDERRRLRKAALEYDSIPSYGSLLPSERKRWKTYLAQRLGKPKEEVVPADWERLNTDWKVPSLVHVTLDAGLRPCEIERAKISWIRPEKDELHIPKEEAAKNSENWNVSLLPKTTRILERWLEQREARSKYDGCETLWLNRQGNPYTSASLRTILTNLCELAEIDQTNRRIVWYSFRHSLGTHMTDAGNLAQAKEQLRHKSLRSTLKYKQPSHKARRDTLNKIG